MAEKAIENGSGRLAGRRIIVTGASSGIGLATARLFLAEGAKVTVLDLGEAGDKSLSGNDDCLFCKVDVADEKNVADAVDKAASQMGGIDGVVNAAGIMLVGPLAEFPFEDWHKTINVNLTGTFNVVRCSIPFLKKEKEAAIVNIASAAGLLPNSPGLAAYAASKGGVIALTKALAADLAPDIRVNCVCPGLVNTPMGADFLGNTGNYAMKRAADPAEIAASILYLMSREASFVTGAALAVDGGRSFH